jgi:hypothetical protein
MANHASRSISGRNRDVYLSFRSGYTPERVRLAIIAESPPISGKYFYDPAGSPSEQLFVALMRQLDLSPRTKQDGLAEFQRNGWVLVDATYQPVNSLKTLRRNEIIARDYPLLRDDLARLIPDRSAPLILIKANVCRLLEPRLLEDGFHVINRGRAVYFPGSGQQKNFHQQFGAIRLSAGI